MTQPVVLNIPWATLSNEQTGDIITFAQFEEGNLVVNECNVGEDNELMSASIDDSSTDDDSGDWSISMKALEDIRDGNHVHTGINTRYVRFKIRDHILQA